MLECFRTGEQIDSSNLQRIASSGAYLNKREVTKRFNLNPGEYVIIPSTFEEDAEIKFLLRIFSEKPLNNLCSGLDELKKLEVGNLNFLFLLSLTNFKLTCTKKEIL